MSNYIERAGRIVRRIHELAAISEDGRMLCRTYGTQSYLAAAKLVLQWMLEAGLEARIDAIGNVRGTWRETSRGAHGRRTLVIGSHIDTVTDAGKWDGPLGVLMGLDLLEQLNRLGLRPGFDIELIAFCDEEGVRFHTTYLGSRLVAGSFESGLLDLRDRGGVSLREAILSIGGDPAKLEDEVIAPERWLGYFEIHIEQGPVLYERRIPVAGVSAIAGQVRVMARFRGVAGHAGTVPMDMRNDALCGVAELVLAVEETAVRGKVLATVGRVDLVHAASNVIPGTAACSIDIRSDDVGLLTAAHERLRMISQAIAVRRGLGVEWEVLQSTPVVHCDADLRGLLWGAIGDSGIEMLELVSGAGHDAVPISAVAPVCMLFVRCYKGISHNPQEDVETADIAAAIEAGDKFLLAIINCT